VNDGDGLPPNVDALCLETYPAAHALPLGFVPLCLPTNAGQPPSGVVWLREIKHDGFRVIARKDGARVRLYSRPGNDLTDRFPLIVETLSRLRSRSCIIDGETLVCDDNEHQHSSPQSRRLPWPS
jgi:ATP-dependent DNA ligase